jgi:hypothetical protein
LERLQSVLLLLIILVVVLLPRSVILLLLLATPVLSILQEEASVLKGVLILNHLQLIHLLL